MIFNFLDMSIETIIMIDQSAQEYLKGNLNLITIIIYFNIQNYNNILECTKERIGAIEKKDLLDTKNDWKYQKPAINR